MNQLNIYYDIDHITINLKYFFIIILNTMKTVKYFNFSPFLDNNISAIISKKNQNLTEKSSVDGIKYFGRKFKLDHQYIAIPIQTHSSNCKIIDNHGIYQNTDGIITKNKKITLSLSIADCCPIFIYDKKLKTRGLIHSGWKGTVNKICINAIDKFLELKSSLDNLKIYLGPSIQFCCFEVDNDVGDLFHENCKIRKRNKKFHVNLQKQIMIDLMSIGLKKHQINASKICTFENNDCESYRREKENSGRMLALFGEFTT